jgi:flagellar motor switch protein FliN/FliY
VPLLQAHPNADSNAQQQRLRRVMKLQVPVIVKLAERKILLSEVMRLGVGAIIEFVKSSNEPLDLMISNKSIGQGETVKVGENFGVRITRVGDSKQILQAVVGR